MTVAAAARCPWETVRNSNRGCRSSVWVHQLAGGVDRDGRIAAARSNTPLCVVALLLLSRGKADGTTLGKALHSPGRTELFPPASSHQGRFIAHPEPHSFFILADIALL